MALHSPMTSPTPELISYFKTNLDAGYSREALTQAAKTIGWSEEVITRAWDSLDTQSKIDMAQPTTLTSGIPETAIPIATLISGNTETPYRSGESFVHAPEQVTTTSPTYTTHEVTPSPIYTSRDQTRTTSFPAKKEGSGSFLVKIVFAFILLICIGSVALFLIPFKASSPLGSLQEGSIETIRPLLTFINTTFGNKEETQEKEATPLSTFLDTDENYQYLANALERYVSNPQRSTSTVGTFIVEFPLETLSTATEGETENTSPTDNTAKFVLESRRIGGANPMVWTNFLMTSNDATEADLSWYHNGETTLMKIDALSILADMLTPDNAPKKDEWFRIDNPQNDLQFINLFGFPVDLARMYLHQSKIATIRPFMRTIMNDTSLSITKATDSLSLDTDTYHISVNLPLFTEHLVRLLRAETSWDPTREATIRLWLAQFSELSFDLTILRTDQSLASLAHHIALTNASGIPIRIDAVTTFTTPDIPDQLPATPTASTRSIAGFMESIIGQQVNSINEPVSVPATTP